MDDKKKFLNLIQLNIDKYGYHLTTVISYTEPRYVYTIGLTKVFGFELIFAGGIYFMKNELNIIFDTVIDEFKSSKNILQVFTNDLGSFSLSKVNDSWSKVMMLGVFDFYNESSIQAFQIVPNPPYHTLDIPDLTKEWSAASEPVWQWLFNEWNYAVPKDSTVVTNLKALYGVPITEIMRWEEDEWEMFAGPGPDVEKEEIRVVSIGTILGIDKTLHQALNLDVGKGIWRDSVELKWNKWG